MNHKLPLFAWMSAASRARQSGFAVHLSPLLAGAVLAAPIVLGPPAPLRPRPISAPVIRTLEFDERVRARTAIERVYQGHRTGQGGSAGAAVNDAVVEAKVRRQIATRLALENVWGRRVTPREVSRELERIARKTKFPARLQEIYEALGNDRFLIEECLAKPLLVERLARSAFEGDAGIHAAARAEAEAIREGLLSGAVGQADAHPRRSVTEFRRRAAEGSDAAPAEPEPPAAPDGVHRVELDPEAFDARRQSLPETGEVAPLAEEPEAFAVAVVTSEGEGAFEVTSWVVPKRAFEDWLSEVTADWDTTDASAASAASGAPPPAAPTSCTDDTWDPGALRYPEPRSGHSAVWTGSEMLVWGGSLGSNLGFGYDPVLDDWRWLSAAGAPPPRGRHVAVWTGREMIVWGGEWLRNDGARYDPASDTWRPVSSVGAPAGRHAMTAVWTGSEMIVWGGEGPGGWGCPNQFHGDGARYDPSTDTWSSMSGEGAPAPREGHVAVWTGTEMIVWGGFRVQLVSNGECGYMYNGFPEALYLDDGGSYDPAEDRWTPLSAHYAPTGRDGASAVWTGEEMIVWGGSDDLGATATGGRYRPRGHHWTPVTMEDAPRGRRQHTAVWTGEVMIVWGGDSAEGGGRYEPGADRWVRVSEVAAPSQRTGHATVWTGEYMVVWGGSSTDVKGGRYDPATDTWMPTKVPPSARYDHTAVWTGSEMIVWGGYREWYALSTGDRYDPVSDSWTPSSMNGAPSARTQHSAIWTGREMIVWGGLYVSSLATGGRYDPATDSWRATSNANVPSGRYGHSAVWTGTEMVVWGGSAGFYPYYLSTGGRYDPFADSWAPTSTLRAPAARYEHTAVWNGSEMVVWGGYNSYIWPFNPSAGGRYDPFTNSWRPTSTTNAPQGRSLHTAVWTGSEMVVWGGYNPYASPTNPSAGGRYDPFTDSWRPTSTTNAPQGRSSPTAVWTGSEMVVWGGTSTNTGGRYDPATDSWRPTSGTAVPVGRGDHTAVLADGLLLLWGGKASSSAVASGGAYAIDRDADGLCLGDNCPAVSNVDQIDGDADGAGDACDTCPGLANPLQADSDNDGAGDACDTCTDADRDGFGNPGFPLNTCPADNCPGSPDPTQADTDGDALGDACDTCTDTDGDGRGNPGFPRNVCTLDNCPDTPNADQRDADRDRVGDVCDACTDVDRDGWGDPGFPATTCALDNCPSVANVSQADADGDDVGDACDTCTDTDGDGTGDPGYQANRCPSDNCPSLPNPGQSDADRDGVGDACDPCPSDALNDADVDGVCGGVDNCPLVPNTDQADSDADGHGDGCDNCPGLANPGQADFDSDGAGNACDPCTDWDRDGFGDPGFPVTTCARDNCGFIPNPDQADSDADGHGDACDACPGQPGEDPGDPDGDFVSNCVDNCPSVWNIGQYDSDSDGVGDVCDNCDGESNPDQLDSDGDGIGDACDNCATRPNATQENADGDGAGDACDNCPTVSSYDLDDADGDGRGNACDLCPLDPLDDTDGDGVCGPVDNCPGVPNPDQADTDHGPFDGQWASTATASSQYGDADWSAARATGWPDVGGCLESVRAWAPLAYGADPEWLEVRFVVPVHATGVRVVESSGSPFVTRIELVDEDGAYHAIWEGADTTACGGTFDVSFAETEYLVAGVRVTTAADGWEEIDAVRLIGAGVGPAPDGVGDACEGD